MVEIREIITTEAYNEILKNEKVVLKCSAEWCFPCKALGTTIKNLDSEKVKDVVFGEINIEDDFAEPILEDFSIRGIPVLLFFKNGELIEKTVGNIGAAKIYEIIEKMN